MAIFLDVFSILGQATPSLTWTIALWAVVGIITATTLILFRTRWKGISPVWKCAILSVIAHIILVAALYSTHLVLDSGGGGGVESFSVSLVDDSDGVPDDSSATTNSDDNIEPDVPPWEQSSAAFSLLQTTTASRPAPPPLPVDLPAYVPEFAEPEPEPVATDATLAEDVSTPESPLEQGLADTAVSPSPIEAASTDVTPTETETMEAADSDVTVAQPANVKPALADSELEIAAKPPEASSDDSRPSPSSDVIESNPKADERADEPHASNMASSAMTEDAIIHQHAAPAEPTTTPPVHNASTQPATRLRPADNAALPTLYRNRVAGSRGEIARSLGGSRETETAVEQGLAWLAHNQETTGQWNCARHGGGVELRVLGHDRDGAGTFADPGVTGLALLAFLGAGNSHFEGPWRENVQHGLEYLVSIQGADGSLAGPSKLYARMYCHSMATLALAEAYAMTGDERLRGPVQRAVHYSLRSQDRRSGGWRYRPGDEGDMSQFGWQVMALKSARVGGIEIPQEAERLMISFLNRCSGGLHGGLAGYRPGQPPTPTMTAEALLCRYLLQDSVDQPVTAEAATLIQRATPDPRAVNYYHWYYGTLAAFHARGELWQTWNRDLKSTLLTRQNRQGATAGSWDPDGVWCGYGGRVYSTAMATLCLEVYYRYAE